MDKPAVDSSFVYATLSKATAMETQNYANHTRLVTPFHKILFPLLVLTLIGSCVNLYKAKIGRAHV